MDPGVHSPFPFLNFLIDFQTFFPQALQEPEQIIEAQIEGKTRIPAGMAPSVCLMANTGFSRKIDVPASRVKKTLKNDFPSECGSISTAKISSYHFSNREAS